MRGYFDFGVDDAENFRGGVKSMAGDVNGRRFLSRLPAHGT
jgi:hypothetical protein